MIKIKLTNWDQGRNEPTFRPLLFHHQLFPQVGVQFVIDGSYDLEFIGMNDFINKKIPLKDSIEYGLECVGKRNGNYFLFDGSDSTSIMGSYEVFKQSNALHLFKSAKTTIEQYKIPSLFNKWWFGEGEDLNLSYDIPPEVYNNIKLTGWNFGYYNPNYLKFYNSDLNRDIDICAIYMGNHYKQYCHSVRDDIPYTEHRIKAWEILKNSKNISYEINKRPFPEFAQVMLRSKCTLSPYGQGELCYRDFEIIQFGSVMIKPDMSKVLTHPNIYLPYETYIPCALDYSDLLEKVQWVKENPMECDEIVRNSRKLMQEYYTGENLVLYWYNLLNDLNN